MGIHVEEINSVFNDSSIGSDLPNADIKTTRIFNKKYPKVSVKYSDFELSWLIVWILDSNEGYIAKFHHFIKTDKRKNLIEKYRGKIGLTSIYLNEIKRKAIFSCNSLEELKQYYDENCS